MKARAAPRPTHPRKVKTIQQPNEKKPEEKKIPNNPNVVKGAPKPVSKRPDIFEVQKPLVTSCLSLSEVVKAFSNGTDEFRNLLNYECELIYECKVCRSLFRSLSNFLQHKRSHCLDRTQDLKRNFFNGDGTEQAIHVNGTNSKGQLIATRKTMRKDIYEILKKVSTMEEEPLPKQFFTKDMEETNSAILSFFKQEGKAATEERSATLGSDGFVLGSKSAEASRSEESQDAASHSNGRLSLLKCTKCDETFSSADELRSHSTQQNCSKLRRCYVCPLCKKIVATPWNVYRHLRRVHHKTAEQVRRLRHNIEKKMVKAEEIKTKSPPTPVKKPVLSEKTQEMIKSMGIGSRLAAGTKNGSSSFSSPNAFKRGRSPDADIVKNRILEVRSYDKSSTLSPFKNGTDSSSYRLQRPDMGVKCLLNSPQPRVVLTKAHLSPSVCASLRVKSEPDSSQGNNPSDDAPGNPSKKIKMDKDLSWLKRGPSVPIIGGPLTRTARALYGSPRKLVAADNDTTEWKKSDGNMNRVETTIKPEDESTAVGPRDDSSENEIENTSGLDDQSPSAGEDNDSDDFGAKKPKDKSSSITKRLSSSEDNVRSTTSSVDSFDSTPSKEKNSVVDLNDRMSTSGVETEIDRPATTTTTSSAGPSDDDSPDVEPRVDSFFKGSSPRRGCGDVSAYPPSQSSSDCIESMEEGVSRNSNSHKANGEVKQVERKTCAMRTRSKSTESQISLSLSPSRAADCGFDDLAVSPAPSEVAAKPSDDCDDTNSSKEEEQEKDDQLMKNMMEVIFGSHPPTSYNISRDNDSSGSSS